MYVVGTSTIASKEEFDNFYVAVKKALGKEPYDQLVVYDGKHLRVSPNPDMEGEPGDREKMGLIDFPVICEILNEAMQVAREIY